MAFLKGKRLSEEHKKKLSESHKNQTSWNKGKKGWTNNGSFKKGQISWNKNRVGLKCTEETKKKMSETHKRIGTGKWMLGRKLSEETKRKISENSKKLGLRPPSSKGKTYEELYGKRKADLLKKKRSESLKGEKCHWWRGGITSLRGKIYHSQKYHQWRSNVFQRDNWTCQTCYVRKGKELHPHHIKSFAKILEEYNIKILEEALNCEELWDVNNGITLCKDCHKLTNNYGSKNRGSLF